MDVKYLKRVFFGVLTAVASIAFASYLIYHIVLYFNNNIVTTAAVYATEQQYFDCEGYIFRDERILTSSALGTVCPAYDDGSKVGIGSTVVYVYGSAKDAERVDEISELEKQIAILRDSSSGGNYSDIGQVNKKVSMLVSELRVNLSDGEVSDALALRDSLLVQLNRTQLLTNVVDSFDGQIASLEDQISALKTQLGSVSGTVTAPQSGYFYSFTDGCETLFGASSLESLTPASFARLTAAVPNALPDEGAIGKLATEYRWYLVVSVERAESEKYTKGRFYDIVFEDNANERLSLSLENIIFEPNEPNALLVFCCTNSLQNFDFVRCQSLRIIQKEYTGYQVPRSAVRMIDGQQGVFVLSGATVRFRKIQPVCEADGYWIVSERDALPQEERAEYLDLNESVIIHGKKLYDGKIIVG